MKQTYSSVIILMKKVLLLSLLVSVILASTSYAQQPITKMQSLYIYNFIKNIKWKNVEEKYVVGVFGDDTKVADMQGVIGVRKFNSKAIEVKKITSVTEASNCQIVFVSSEFKSNIANLNNPTVLKNTLLVSEEGGIDSGVSIAFIQEDSKLKFKINEPVCKNSGLQVSATLLSLGQ